MAAVNGGDHLQAALAARVTVLTEVQHLETPLYRCPPSVVVSTPVVVALWQEFKRYVAEPVPSTPDAAAEAPCRVRQCLEHLPGVFIPAKLRLATIYSGTPRDGFCDLMVREGDGAVAAYRGLLFSEMLPGLVMTLFFGAALGRYWSWGHGHYDRDAELIVSGDRLTSLLANELRGAALGGDERWPMAGVRLNRLDDAYEVACLAARPGRGLYDVSIPVRDGQPGPMQVRDVFVWGQGLLY